jgi:phosphate transport system substrate-binding protein
MKKKDKKAYKKTCHTLREDGAYVEAGENDNLIVQKLESNHAALGVFGFSYLDQNRDKIQGSLINGKKPQFESIADGSYPISRPLFFYVKKAHVGVIPGMKEYLSEFTADKAWGEDGYLSDRGLVPMPTDERNKYASDAKNLTALKL